ncbi:MAG: type II secretion system protein [Acidobacteriota bacterium]
MTESTKESGMTLMAVMVFMTIFAFILMVAAPSIQMDVQREKELESIRRGEEIANAIHQYFLYHQGQKLPSSLDELIEGLPDGTRKRQILRPSALTDPLTLDGKWRLIPAEPDVIARFAKRVQAFNNGILPSSPQPVQFYNRYTVSLANVLNTETEEENEDADDEDSSVTTDGPFIGVASSSRSRSILTYYGIENHSKWIFTPLFRGVGATSVRPTRPPR